MIIGLTCTEARAAGLDDEPISTEDTEQEDEPMLCVTAVTMSGQRASVNVSVNSKVSHVRQQLALSFAVRLDQLRLCLGENMLDDDCKLLELSVDGAVLVAVLTMPAEVARRAKELSDPQPNVRQRAARALGSLGEISAQAVPALEKVLLDPTEKNEEVRMEAASALGLIGPKASGSIEVLHGALQQHFATAVIVTPTPGDDTPKQPVHYFPSIVLGALGKIGGEGVPIVMKAMERDDLRAFAVLALGEAGEAAAPALPGLVAALQDDKDICVKAAQAIACIGKAAIPALEGMLNHTDDSVCKVAVAALGSFGGVALKRLGCAIQSCNPRVRAGAASALGQIRDERAAQLLQDALKDPDWAVCLAATAALGQMGDMGMSSLEKALKIDYWVVQDKLVEILENSGSCAVPLLEQMIQDSDLAMSLRIRAIAALGRIGSAAAEAIATLASRLSNLPLCLRAQVVGTIGMMGDAAIPVVPVLEELLTNSDESMDARTEAAEALAHVGTLGILVLGRTLKSGVDASCCRLAAEVLGKMGAAAVSTLAAALEEPDAHIRERCASALGVIGREALPAAPALVRLLDDVHPWVRWQAADSLGGICAGSISVPALVQRLGDSCESVRVAAVVALGKQGAAATIAVGPLNYVMDDPELCRHVREALGAITLSDKKCAIAYARLRVEMTAMECFGTS